MKEYSFNDNTILVNGVVLTGWADGDNVINATRRADSATDKMGVDGVMHVSRSNNRSGEITFRLMQTSDSNLYLSSLSNVSDFTTVVPVSVTIRNAHTGETVKSTAGYIKKPADIILGGEINVREWTLVVEDLVLLNT